MATSVEHVDRRQVGSKPMHDPSIKAITAQLMTAFAAATPFAHTGTRHPAMQVKSGVPMKHPIAHMTPSAQVVSMHFPQSAGQFAQFSSVSHLPSPQNEQTPQSAGQLKQFSPVSHEPSPQPLHMPQSVGHVWQSSPALAWHLPSPQLGHAPQS